MSGRTAVRCLLILLAVAASRCAPVVPYRVEAVPTQHIVMVESSGLLMDPTGSVRCRPDELAADNAHFIEENKKQYVKPLPQYSWTPCNGRFNGLRMLPLSETQRAGYVRDVFRGMDAYYGPPKPGEHQVRRIALIVHGGLNTNHSTIERAQRLSQRILDNGYYPLFINWQSNLPRALLEHTVSVRQGNDLGPLKGSPLAVPYLLADLGRGLVRTPVIWAYEAKNDLDRVKLAVRKYLSEHHLFGVELQPRETEKIYNRLRELRESCIDRGVASRDCDAVDVERGTEKYRLRDHVRDHALATPTAAVPPNLAIRALGGAVAAPWSYALWVPLRYLTAPLLDGLGSAAWEDMQRHAILGFYNDGTRATAEGDPNERGGGGLSYFMDALQTEIADDRACTDKSAATDPCIEWHFNLIGHSMGAIVANQLLYNFDDFKLDNVVYMAAACSVRDYERAVHPYMKQHRETQMWHLVLNDLAEVRDQYFFEVPPSGSLLVWIDHFFTQPHTWRDRTAGRWENLARFLEGTPKKLRSRVHVRSFDGADDELAFQQPQHHGAFLEFTCDPATKYVGMFWDPAFWRTDLTDFQPKRQQQVATAQSGQ